ncbi:hypothetical protein [Bacteroides sp. 51]|uniref:hypothetical protein n=1 Tax=Bacteroides sp. 51 TaxID=2302938 RepID=UPI0013D3EBFA|nr:hypothetical protein [Bacteroides sp. 51]NDV80803.1 hypothetical protein [Bacteroides sp. 51]
MKTVKFNATQYAELARTLTGTILVYTTQDGKESAQQFFGPEFEPADKSENEIFRVWKNVMATFWSVKAEENKLREDNDGIRSKLRASTPSSVIFRTAKGETVKSYQLDESVWARIGLVPTKKDFERTARDYAKAIHRAAKASFDALGFRIMLAKEETTEVSKTEKKVKPTEKPLPLAAAS